MVSMVNYRFYFGSVFKYHYYLNIFERSFRLDRILKIYRVGNLYNFCENKTSLGKLTFQYISNKSYDKYAWHISMYSWRFIKSGKKHRFSHIYFFCITKSHTIIIASMYLLLLFTALLVGGLVSCVAHIPYQQVQRSLLSEGRYQISTPWGSICHCCLDHVNLVHV